MATLWSYGWEMNLGSNFNGIAGSAGCSSHVPLDIGFSTNAPAMCDKSASSRMMFAGLLEVSHGRTLQEIKVLESLCGRQSWLPD